MQQTEHTLRYSITAGIPMQASNKSNIAIKHCCNAYNSMETVSCISI